MILGIWEAFIYIIRVEKSGASTENISAENNFYLGIWEMTLTSC